jgi:hypothetical protein
MGSRSRSRPSLGGSVVDPTGTGTAMDESTRLASRIILGFGVAVTLYGVARARRDRTPPKEAVSDLLPLALVLLLMVPDVFELPRAAKTLSVAAAVPVLLVMFLRIRAMRRHGIGR